MTAARRLRLVNLSARDEMELELLLPLIGGRAGDACHWEAVRAAGADAAIVDVDRADGPEALQLARSSEHYVIAFSVDDSADTEFQLARPLRTENLARVLDTIAQSLDRDTGPASGNEDMVTAEGYRLLRWPPTEVLRREWRHTRVCGALSRGPQTLDDLRTRTGIDETELHDLLGALEARECVIPAAISGGRVRRSAAAMPSGLLGRLRARLGMR